MPFVKGQKKVSKSGRKVGSKNKINLDLEAMCERLKVNPFEVLARIAAGDIPCGTCHGVGKTKYQPKGPDGDLRVRTCQSCYGSKLENVTTGDRTRACMELCKYIKPQLKAMEVNVSQTTAKALVDILSEREARNATN